MFGIWIKKKRSTGHEEMGTLSLHLNSSMTKIFQLHKIMARQGVYIFRKIL